MYDPFGRRVSKTVFGNPTGFLYDWLNPVQELSGTTPTANMLTGGIDEYFMRTDASGTVNYLTDALGSTLALTDTTGTIRTQYAYEPFGATSVSGILSTNSYQYTGRENDGTGLYYYRARYYNAIYGRFSSEDPIGFHGGSNFYAYVGDDPVDFFDPLGLDKRGPNPNPPLIGPNPNPPLDPCIKGALLEGAFSIGVDSIGLIPEGGGAGTVARKFGNFFGYRGIVADNFGKAAIRQIEGANDTISLTQGVAEQDWISTGLTVAGFIPALGQVAAGLSISYDIYKTWEKIQECP